jgi:5-methylcytosine-specific restriction endonuclease McrA
MAKRKGDVSRGIRRKVYEMNLVKHGEYTCEYCNKKPLYRNQSGESHMQDNTITVDHIIPFSKGGSNKMDNLIACCFECNNKKADNLYVR